MVGQSQFAWECIAVNQFTGYPGYHVPMATMELANKSGKGRRGGRKNRY